MHNYILNQLIRFSLGGLEYQVEITISIGALYVSGFYCKGANLRLLESSLETGFSYPKDENEIMLSVGFSTSDDP